MIFVEGEKMANINLELEDDLKRNFKIQTTKNRKQMSPILRDFMAKFIKNPKETMKFLYEGK